MGRLAEILQNKALDENETAQYLGVSVRSVQAWRGRGGGPVFVKFGRAVRYMPEDLDAWIDANRKQFTSTS
ncbi:helix-turn-helix domain-containing protein [Roseibium sp. RKSG952]|uniref:helix-turn-helix domain-containing protein n=1 Tax=Roseibium sp. RKSG952 TaxID=2529384 RepID=UPI0012BD03C4|nr:helix-turn-helix domain-containing protein [Roseibium sp. RKSG952]MTH96128.1 DNA-binding protein [Roseibium sp. RKSG952]